MTAPAARSVALAVAFSIGAAAGGTALGWTANALRDRDPQVALDLVVRVQREMGRLIRSSESRVLFFGDSLVMDPHPPDTSVPVELEAELERATGGPVPLARIANPGQSLVALYWMSERIVEADPKLVVISLNLASFSETWLRRERFEMASLLPLPRWGEVLDLPLHSFAGSFDRLIFDRGIVRLGLLHEWRQLQRAQVRLAAGYWELESWLLGSPSERRVYRLAPGLRYGADRVENERARPLFARERFGAVLAGLRETHPAVRVLDRLLARLKRAGIPVLVYVAPMNVEHLERIDVFDAAGLAASLRVLAGVTVRQGAHFLDLHALLPDRDFLDANDHLREEGNDLPSRRVAERLAPWVLTQTGHGEVDP